MEPNQGRKIAMTLSVMSITLCQDGQSSFLCTHCDSPVEIHQPDADLPYRMLGTCDHCHAWYLLTTDSGEDRALVIELPDSSQLDLDRNTMWPMTNGQPS